MKLDFGGMLMEVSPLRMVRTKHTWLWREIQVLQK